MMTEVTAEAVVASRASKQKAQDLIRTYSPKEGCNRNVGLYGIEPEVTLNGIPTKTLSVLGKIPTLAMACSS